MNKDHQDVYRICAWSKNCILITFPAWRYNLLLNRDTYESGLKATNVLAEIIDALNNALHIYHDDINGNQESGCDVQRGDKYNHVLL